MNKKMMQVNVFLLALMLGVAVWYAGYECGDYLVEYLQEVMELSKTKWNVNFGSYRYIISTFHFPVACVAFLVCGISCTKKQHYSKTYNVAAIVTAAYPLLVLLINLITYDPGKEGRNCDLMDLFVIPGIMLFLSAVIAINYILCGIKAKKELGY